MCHVYLLCFQMHLDNFAWQLYSKCNDSNPQQIIPFQTEWNSFQQAFKLSCLMFGIVTNHSPYIADSKLFVYYMVVCSCLPGLCRNYYWSGNIPIYLLLV